MNTLLEKRYDSLVLAMMEKPKYLIRDDNTQEAAQ